MFTMHAVGSFFIKKMFNFAAVFKLSKKLIVKNVRKKIFVFKTPLVF